VIIRRAERDAIVALRSSVDRQNRQRTFQGEDTMSSYSRDDVEVAYEEQGVGEQRKAEEGGMVIAFEHWNAGLDTGEMFKDLPDGACQEEHWGYVIKGSATMRYTDGRTQTITAGQAYYLPPGHNGHIDEEAEFVEFTPADQSPDMKRS
jgi:mannose-6-phosphate isomerase-like protein (cupin superfamily)